MSDSQEIFEIIKTTRAIRRWRTEPVPDAMIERILAAGQCAANGANRQTWSFIVVRSEEIKRRIAEIYLARLYEIALPLYRRSGIPPGMTEGGLERQIREVTYGSEHLSDAPVWIVACMRSESSESRFEGASIYPAVQNMILACRALGLGTVLTTRHNGRGSEADAIFGLPEHVRSYAILPVGFPEAPFGPVRRGPLEDVVFEDTYGQPWSHFERSTSAG